MFCISCEGGGGGEEELYVSSSTKIPPKKYTHTHLFAILAIFVYGGYFLLLWLTVCLFVKVNVV